MSTILSFLLIAIGIIIIIIIIIVIIVLSLIGWCFKWLWALIGFSWEGVIGCIGCFIRFWVYFLMAFVIALLGKMVS